MKFCLRHTRLNEFSGGLVCAECGWIFRGGPSPIFKVGDVVDFINDYGVKFPRRRITAILDVDEHQLGGSRWRYHFEPTDCPWFPSAEKNFKLHNEEADHECIYPGS